jgi:hypothetical protein
VGLGGEEAEVEAEEVGGAYGSRYMNLDLLPPAPLTCVGSGLPPPLS